jgi:hypothetical protein
MKTFQLNGTVASPSVTTAVSALDAPLGSNGLIITNPSTTYSLFVHLVPAGGTTPLIAVVLQGMRIYPGTYMSIALMNELPYGCDIYLAMETGASATTINVYGIA